MRVFLPAALILVSTVAASDCPGVDESAGATAGSEAPPTPREFMVARGFIRYRGMWRTAQEIELLERAERANLSRKAWGPRLERLRKQLDDPRHADAAEESIREIADPFAVPALVAAIGGERMPRVRAYYIEALSHIRGPEALTALVAVALDHADPETRILAVERLAAAEPDLAAWPLIAALGGDDNARINRAAEALGRLGSSSAIGPLIDRLETEHVAVVGGAPEGSTTATFAPSGGGLALGGGPKRQRVRMQNQQVLEALVALTGVNFEWNVPAWRAWLAGRQSPATFDPRRG